MNGTGTKPWYPGFDSSLNDSDPSQIAQIRILVPLMLMKSRFLIVKRTRFVAKVCQSPSLGLS